jgi:hypothetical protein
MLPLEVRPSMISAVIDLNRAGSAARWENEPMEPDRAPRDEVGDPVCWLDRVCPDCGRLAEERDAEACARCGADLPER